MKRMIIAFMLVVMLSLTGCADYQDSSDQVQQKQQEKILAEGTAQTGMPAVHNFEQRRQMKVILEKLDDANLVTYAYTFNEMTGKFRYWGQTMGYGLPAATQYTNPQKVTQSCGESQYSNGSHWCVEGTMPQADPNGLFMPASTDATWILMKDPNSDAVEPIYVEPKVTISPFKFPANIVEQN